MQEAILANKNLNLKVCVDNDKEIADYFSKEFNCISYTDLQKALSRENLTLLVLFSDHTHYEITKIY